MFLPKNLILSSRLTDKYFLKYVLNDNKLIKQTERMIQSLTENELNKTGVNRKMMGNFPQLSINFCLTFNQFFSLIRFEGKLNYKSTKGSKQ